MGKCSNRDCIWFSVSFVLLAAALLHGTQALVFGVNFLKWAPVQDFILFFLGGGPLLISGHMSMHENNVSYPQWLDVTDAPCIFAKRP